MSYQIKQGHKQMAESVMSDYKAAYKSIPLFYSLMPHKVIVNQGASCVGEIIHTIHTIKRSRRK